ncbi:hypothetical protein RSAG8_13289, partial [Rhizoctonia solani AG-8 WAC10335]
MASKTLNIYAYGLQKDTSLMLMFEPPNSSKLFKDQFPFAHFLDVIFRMHCSFRDQDRDNLVDSAAWVEVVSGDISSISGDAGQKRFAAELLQRAMVPSSSSAKTTPTVAQTLALVKNLGFLNGDGVYQRYEPTLVWAGVGSKSNITAAFTPVLSAYVTRDYKATEMLRGEVETDAIWSCNLNLIDDVTGWHLFEDDASGAFTIEPAIKP